jgi:hypothetical protein
VGLVTLASVAVSTVSCISPLAPDADAALGIPFRFLVADGRQQAPILAALLRRFFEPLLVQRQAALQMRMKPRAAGELASSERP